MKKTALALGLIASAALSVPAAQAQGTTNPDLRCAAWAMLAGAQEQDEGKKNALGFMMAYFIGRYEQASGGKIQMQITPQTMEDVLGDIDEANAVCGPRANDFGQRLQQTLKGMQAPASQAQGR
ncbi:hypothetical protein [Croceicoccus marinus]|jgi:hypothetical protein|uniref:Uncharacterized protein n=1 Tax=Croceicoccus marinus TaxID=450378 RepID=A0A7G6VWI7_9SPHN|nr:hypothetical protein [Croceicoccus marinus]QNE06102.1 hypothetical protein H4O24_05565 [Croceicoccus marinus]